MAINLNEFQVLKNTLGRLQGDADKAEGAYAEQLKRLQDEHDCKTIGQAKIKLKKYDKEVKTAEKKYETAAAKFEDDWSDVLEDLR